MSVAMLFLDDEGRLRSGWRFAVFVTGFIFLTVLLVTPPTLLYPREMTETVEGRTAVSLLLLIAALVVGWLCNRFLDGLPFSALGASFTAGWFKHTIIGMAVGTLTLTLAVGIAAAFGGLSFTADAVDWSSIARTLGLSFAIFVVGAASEEALCRGYPMQTFFHSKLAVFGIIFLSLIFSVGHLGNRGADLLSTLNTFIAGIWFGVAYLKTRDLWLPFGMHLMWNWMQGAFFGLGVSGLTNITAAPLLREIDRGPAWLTGEAYGIEAGIAGTIALIISTLVIYFWPQKGSENTLSDNPAAFAK